MRSPSVLLSRSLLAIGFLGLAFLYFYRLADAPVHLAHDEAMFGVVAHDIAWHGRDVDGNVLPVFMHMNGVYWNMPAHVYLTALFVRLFGTNEAVIRASSTAASLFAVFLIYAFGRRVFRHRGFAALAAGLLALSPAFFIDSRLSTDHHYPVVAIGLWLLCLARFFEDPDRDLWLALAGASLGFGLYTYAASVLLMPIYAAITALVLIRMRVHRLSAYAVFGLTFAVAVVPFVIFVFRHPEYVGDVANMYNVYDAKRFTALQGARELGSWTSLGARADVYFSYFNPSMLFFSGAGSLVQSTRQAGFFLLPLLVLLPAAIIGVLKRDADWFAWLALVAFFATPLAASIVDEHGAVQRVISLAPFAAILVTYLATHVSAGSRTWIRAGAWLLIALVPVSFGRFYYDYLGDYRQRSSFYFEQNIGGALEAAIDQSRSGRAPVDVCLSRAINPLIDWYWMFYLRKHGAEPLASQTIYFDSPADARNKCAPGIVVVSEIATCDQIAATRARTPEKITEPGGSASFCVF
ncbi:MAG TPA: glycosyltransferase family 39 protein [Vicinamibacterales bacterium]|nr:glycosyltransferase family 39 protein [Vicinamibacterales bacterium]